MYFLLTFYNFRNFSQRVELKSREQQNNKESLELYDTSVTTCFLWRHVYFFLNLTIFTFIKILKFSNIFQANEYVFLHWFTKLFSKKFN